MNLQKLIFTNNDCYKANKKITPKGIMVHSTGANNPNLNRYVNPDDGKLGKNKHNNHWNSKTTRVCVHAFIGKLADGSIATYQTLPWNHRGWHCGSGSKGSANNTHISFEICEDGLTDNAYFLKVYWEAVDLCAYLCKQYGFNPLADGVIIGHYEGRKRGIASNHADPGHWFPKHNKSMDAFRNDVKAKMDGWVEPTPTPKPPIGTSYMVKVTASALNIRKGAGTNYVVSGSIRDKGTYTIVQESSGQGSKKGWGKLKSGAGWISLDYVKRK